MRYLIVFTLLLAACAPKVESTDLPGACAGPAIGIWVNYRAHDIITLNSNCTATSSLCESAFSFTTIDSETAMINVSQTNDTPTCPVLGAHKCYFKIQSYADSPDSMLVGCDHNTDSLETYERY